MGELKLFNLNEIKNKFNLVSLVETGTGDATSLKQALDITKDNKFLNYYSIEIYKPLYEKCLIDLIPYNNFNIELINKNSINGLEEIFKKHSINNNILFWLDAHFPEADFGGPKQYSSVEDKTLRIPLEEELKIIKKYRTNNKDYLIIDDLRIYEDNDYEAGNWKDRKLYGGNGIQFIYDLFNETHEIVKLMNHQGYIILIPKE
jgi:hypothetical protein